jgi:hypothetical protein
MLKRKRKLSTIVPSYASLPNGRDPRNPAQYSEIGKRFLAKGIIPTLEKLHKRRLNILEISGGGAKGAFGTGVLIGWAESGTRPKFDCAGIMPLSPIAKGDVEVFDSVISTNLHGAFLVLAQAAQHVSAGGRIIAFSSSVLAKSFPTYGPYIASKAGVEGLVRVLNNELRGRNVTVNAVAPGPVATELFLKEKSQAQIEQFIKLAPLERLGQPEDVASVVSFLAGPNGAWVNGQVLRANGGLPEQSLYFCSTANSFKHSLGGYDETWICTSTGGLGSRTGGARHGC